MRLDIGSKQVIPTLREHSPDEARDLALESSDAKLREESLRLPELPSPGWELR
ncbi:hypothetical protein [Luteolibacter soli]|uniref:Uncharacterized protein n=1 Tax=Luteolibacter soli TaxID=3135280 RepID=A0ABU9AZ12_9BACT